jgi:hypothetical protein
MITMMALAISIRPIAGWMSTWGLLTYYYDEVANAVKVEMNRWLYGNTAEEYNADNSVLYTMRGRVDCSASLGRGGGDRVADSGQCGDCSRSKFEDVSFADLSYCCMPWECRGGVGDGNSGEKDADDKDGGRSLALDSLLSSGLCQQYQRFWFG